MRQTVRVQAASRSKSAAEERPRASRYSVPRVRCIQIAQSGMVSVRNPPSRMYTKRQDNDSRSTADGACRGAFERVGQIGQRSAFTGRRKLDAYAYLNRACVRRHADVRRRGGGAAACAAGVVAL